MVDNSGRGPQMASESTHIQSAGFTLSATRPALKADSSGLTEAVKDLFADAISKKYDLDPLLVKAQITEDEGYFYWAEPI